MTIAEMLADFTCQLREDNIPEQVWEKAHGCLLNGFGIALAGLGTPYEPVARSAALAMYGRGEATLLGSGEKSSVTGAVMANGALFHGRGQEDTCGAAHLGAVIIPLLVALIESGRGGSAELLPALIAGYEVGGLFEELLAPVTTPAGFRATTLFGTAAAAAAAARLYNLSFEKTVAALGNAVSFSGGLLQTFVEGTDDWRYQVGVTAQTGWIAAELARAGSVSIRQGYEGPKGLARAFGKRDLDPNICRAKIGSDWQTLRVAYKPYPVCAFNQTPVTAALKLAPAVEDGSIVSAEVRMNPYECGYAGMDSKGPFHSISGTLMSIPFCIATALLKGAPDMKAMSIYDDENVNALVQHISLIPDESIPVLSCDISVRLHDGRILTEQCRMTAKDYAYGYPELLSRLKDTCAQEGIPQNALLLLSDFCSAPSKVPIQRIHEAFAIGREARSNRAHDFSGGIDL